MNKKKTNRCNSPIQLKRYENAQTNFFFSYGNFWVEANIRRLRLCLSYLFVPQGIPRMIKKTFKKYVRIWIQFGLALAATNEKNLKRNLTARWIMIDIAIKVNVDECNKRKHKKDERIFWLNDSVIGWHIHIRFPCESHCLYWLIMFQQLESFCHGNVIAPQNK